MDGELTTPWAEPAVAGVRQHSISSRTEHHGGAVVWWVLNSPSSSGSFLLRSLCSHILVIEGIDWKGKRGLQDGWSKWIGGEGSLS